MKLGLSVGLMFAVCVAAHAAQEIVRPRPVPAVIEWPSALSELAKYVAPQTASQHAKPDLIARLNSASARILPNIASSPVPVLVPFDVAAVLRDQPKASEDGTPPNGERYFAGFHAPRFFLAGPAGYDAAFTIQTADIHELADISLPDPVEIQISGFAFTYDVDEPMPEMRPVPAMETKFPGIRRFIHEGFVRYAFLRHGTPYVIAMDCFEGRPRLLRLICSQADRIVLHFLNVLEIAGGTPQTPINVEPPPIVRTQSVSPTFSYFGPGRIFPNSGFRGISGRVDYTAYAPIRFPLAGAPAYANSQIYREHERGRSKSPAREPSSEYSYPWRDNFCERRGYTVGQCPAGIGHQGQDIRPAPCPAPLGNDRCDPAHNVVAVRDGAILRSPKQEAVYIVINNAHEHMRFRYLHMEPRKLDEDNVLSGRDVREGEKIGQVSNYSQKENGTSYHLHFDVQVPTRVGWVFVSPYMTLVVAYEQLIGGRGMELSDSPQAAQATESDPRNAPQSATAVSVEKRPRALHDEHKERYENKEFVKDPAGTNEADKSPNE